MGSSFLLRLLDEEVKRRQGMQGQSPLGPQDESNNPLSMENGPRTETNPGLLQDLQEQPEALATYRQHVEQSPQREDYRPKVTDRIIAGLAGAFDAFGGAGSHTATEMLEAPYKRALVEHGYKGEGLRRSAELENKDERNDIMNRRVANQLQAEQMRNQAKLAEIDMRRKNGEDEVTLKREELAERIRYQTAATEIARTNAQSNRMRAGAYVSSTGIQADAAKTRADASMMNAETYKTTGGRTSSDREIPIQSQELAEEKAVEDLMKMPEYEIYIEQDADGEQVIMRSKMPPDIKKKFDADVKARADERLGRRFRDTRP